jgi:hypothetical protein
VSKQDIETKTAFIVKGPPITKELQQVFGAYGTVVSIVVDNGEIVVGYSSGSTITFVPSIKPQQTR